MTQCTGAFLYTNGQFMEVYQKENHNWDNGANLLVKFCIDVGITNNLKTDKKTELCGRNSSFVELAQKRRITLTYAKSKRSNQIYKTDLVISKLRKK